MEHVRDLDGALRRLSQVLADGGQLHIAVPDASRYAEGEDAPFQEFSVEHINFFGPDSLANLLSGYGFRRVFCDQRMITVNYRTTTPAILAVFKKLSGDQPAATRNPDSTTSSALERYIVKSADADRQIHAAISLLADEQTPVLVWGTGAHTLRLLETSRLGEARITAFIDSNARYQDRQLRGVPILRRTRCAGIRNPS